MATAYPTITGIYTGRSIEPRHLFASGTPRYLPSFASLDGTKTRDTANTDGVNMIRAGTVLGKITSGGKYRNTIIGVTTGAISAATVTSITVPAAVATEVARLITLAAGNVALKLIGPPSAAGTVATTAITATAASGTTLTVSSVTVPAYAVGSLICPADGAEAPSQFVVSAYGLDVIALDGSSIDHTVRLLTEGDINTDNIVGYSGMDASTKTWLKTNLRSNNGGSVLTFSDDR